MYRNDPGVDSLLDKVSEWVFLPVNVGGEAADIDR
jgi:hypothetical protein